MDIDGAPPRPDADADDAELRRPSVRRSGGQTYISGIVAWPLSKADRNNRKLGWEEDEWVALSSRNGGATKYPLRLEHDDLVPAGRETLESERVRQAELEGHVEARRGTHAREIVDRDPAGLDQPHDPSQPALPAFCDFEHAVGRPADRDERGDERQEERLVG